tara:strand:- start:200 stop:412 length:213 start_codon:yes stop_codon:yes gene_type:complete
MTRKRWDFYHNGLTIFENGIGAEPLLEVLRLTADLCCELGARPAGKLSKNQTHDKNLAGVGPGCGGARVQ